MIPGCNLRYSLVSKILHALIALLIIILIALGWWMMQLGYYDAGYQDSRIWHKSLGIIVGFVVFAKILGSTISSHPNLKPTLSTFERIGSQISHAFLLSGMIVLPVSGYFISSSQGAAIEVFSWFSVPAVWVLNEQKTDLMIQMHYYAAYTLLAAIIIHTVAAIKHLIFERDKINRIW